VGQPTAVDLVLNHPSLNAEEAQRLRLISHVSDDGAVAADAVHYAQGLGPSICRRAQDTGQGGHIRRVRL
jgi:enoyl-CoA hydratase/carnithine racemase